MRIASFEKREWIDPVNDRRPMTEDWVLVTQLTEGRKIVTESKYEEKYGWFIDPEDTVLGWMPLPDPME